MACPICLNPEATEGLHNSLFPARQIQCVQCGDFGISTETAEDAASLKPKDRWRVSAWICEYSSQVVKWSDIEQALNSSVPGLHHRANRMLRALSRWYPQGNEFLNSEVFGRLIGVGWNQSSGEVRYMLEEVLQAELGFVTRRDSGAYRITAKGLLHLEGVPNKEFPIGFCAMWFNHEVLPLWTQVIEPAILLSGYSPLKIDIKPHNNKIDDEIVASLRASSFVVADFTGQRGGVYYEAGFAHGLGLPVIFMCREVDVKELHFDVRQYNCILWNPDELDDARSKLKNRILATLGQGPLKVQ